MKEKYVFISYSSKDADDTSEVVSLINSLGIEYWKAPENIPAGSSYAREIVKAIENCTMLLLILSKNSQSSIWVEKEVDCAINNNKKVIPFNIDGSMLTSTFKFYLNNVQMIFKTENSDAGKEELGACLSRYILNSNNNFLFFTKDLKNAYFENEFIEENFKDGGKFELERHRPVMGRNGITSFNRIPVKCRFCGGSLTYEGTGEYVCLSCGGKNYDDFRTIENYLRDHGPRSATQLSRELDIPIYIIRNWRENQRKG